MLQSKSSAAGLTSHTTVVVGIVEGFGIHAQHIFVKFAEVWRNRLLIIFTLAYFAIEILKEGHIFVTGSGIGPTIKAMVEKDMVLEEDLSFHEAFSLGCEGLEGAHKEDIHTDGFRRAFTADDTIMENFWMEGNDVMEGNDGLECCLPNNGVLQTVEEISLI